MSVWGQVTDDAESADLHVGSEPVAEPPDATANNPIADFAVIPLGQLHKYAALSVRLKNALSQAEQLGVLPFKTLGDYVDAGDRAQFQMKMWVPNLGAKSASELALVATTLKYRGMPAPVVDSFDQEALCLALTKLFIEVDATSALAAQGIPVRLATALDLAGLRDKSLAAVLPRLDYLNHEIPRLPNVGAQSRAAWTRSLSGALEAHLRKLEFDAIDAALARDLLVRNISPPADAAERMFLHLEAIERGEVQPPPPPAPEELVTRLITRLMDREQEFLSRRFGLDGGGVQTLEEIGRDHNITRERVRQIEAKAIRKLKQYGRIELTEAMMAAGARLWRYALGDQFAIAARSIGAAEARLPPFLTLALEVCNLKLAQLLPVIAAAVPGGFVDRETDLPALERVRALLDRRLAAQPLPIALPDLIEQGHYDLAMIVVALDPRRRAYWSYIVEGFVGARTRRAVWLHQILRGAGEPLEIVDLVERFNRAGIEAACGVRDAHIVMERSPQLFVEVFDGTWMGLGETPGIIVDAATSAPVPTPALDEEADDIDEIEEGDAEVQATTNRDALEAELRRRGPCRGSDLMDRFAEILPEGRAATSVGPTLISHKDVFTRLLPGIYALEDQIPTAQSILDDPPAYLLDESQARTYAFGRRSGEPWGAFVLWTPEAEYALCRWAKRHADTPLLESLLSVASIEAWPIDETEKTAWRAFAAERGRFVIGFDALASSWILPELDEVLSAALLLRRQGHLGWIKANRVLNRRVIDHVSIGLLAVLVALGAATPSENWQTPQATGPGLEPLIARLQAQRIRSGRLNWAAGPGPELVRQALDARADVLGWVDPERLIGLFVALEPAPAPEAQPSSPLDRLLRQRAERLRASQSAATLASLQSFDNSEDDA